MRINEVRNNWYNSYDGDWSLLDRFEAAITKFINFEIDVDEYVDRISELDEWAFRLYWGSYQKTNWLNTGQNKKYPIIKETIWTAVMERIRRILVEKTGLEFVLIQGKAGGQVAVACFESGEIKTKDVDTGIALKHPEGFLVPVIAAECKGGHACSTCHDGIWGQAVRMKKQFPNALQVFITDNNVTVAKKIDVSTYDEIDFEYCERGENNLEKFYKQEGYNKLNPEIFKTAIEQLVSVVSNFDESYWMTMNPRYKNIGEKFRDSIDEVGYFVSPKWRNLVTRDQDNNK
jgi:ferredoxin